MSLKVPRGFKTISEDAIADTYSQLRRQAHLQDRHARRQREQAEGWAKLSRIAGFAVGAVVVLAAAKPVYQYVSMFI